MPGLRKTLGTVALGVIVVELVLVLGGVLSFSSAARFALIMESVLALVVAFEIHLVVKAVRRARSCGTDLPWALEEALAEFLPNVVARFVRQDLMLLRALWLLVTGRRDVRVGETPVANAGPLVVLISTITVLDGLAAFLLHLLLPAGIRTIALVLGVIGLVWLLGFLASLICYPHVVSRDRVRLRFSAFQDVSIPMASICEVRPFDADPRSAGAGAPIGDQLIMAVAGQVNLTMTLEEESEAGDAVTALPPKLATPRPCQVTFFADDRAGARRLIEQQRAR